MKCNYNQNDNVNEKINTVHNFVQVARLNIDSMCNVDEVIYWCTVCGTMKVEAEMDYRVLESKTRFYHPSKED